MSTGTELLKSGGRARTVRRPPLILKSLPTERAASERGHGSLMLWRALCQSSNTALSPQDCTGNPFRSQYNSSREMWPSSSQSHVPLLTVPVTSVLLL